MVSTLECIYSIIISILYLTLKKNAFSVIPESHLQHFNLLMILKLNKHVIIMLIFTSCKGIEMA